MDGIVTFVENPTKNKIKINVYNLKYIDNGKNFKCYLYIRYMYNFFGVVNTGLLLIPRRDEIGPKNYVRPTTEQNKHV